MAPDIVCGTLSRLFGKPINKFRWSFKTAVKNAGINYPCRMYELRHLLASTVPHKKGDIAEVSKVLGCSSISTTANVYCHALQGAKERWMERLPEIPDGAERVTDNVVKLRGRR
jgi:hypothetical protein